MPDAVRLDTLTAEDFAPHTGSAFDLCLADGSVLVLTLREVTPLGRDTLPRRPFSLLFHAAPRPALPQQIYPLSHTVLGTHDIFLVPVGETAERREYQAVFS